MRLAANKVGGANPQDRVAPTRRNLGERDKHKNSADHLRMRQYESASGCRTRLTANAGIRDAQDIQVKLSWSPTTTKPPAGAAFQMLQPAQQGRRRHRRLQANDHIVENRLPVRSKWLALDNPGLGVHA